MIYIFFVNELIKNINEICVKNMVNNIYFIVNEIVKLINDTIQFLCCKIFPQY
jgi:hypothetical protein